MKWLVPIPLLACLAGLGFVLNPGAAMAASPAKTLSVEAKPHRLRVVVADIYGVLPGAAVTVDYREGNGPEPELFTDRRGAVDLSLSRCGKQVSVEVSFDGYGKSRIDELDLCRIESAQFCLREEVVEICRFSCGSPLIDLEKTSSSTRFRSSFMHGLPGASGRARRERWLPNPRPELPDDEKFCSEHIVLVPATRVD